MRRHALALATAALAACTRQPTTDIVAHGTIEVIETDVSPMATARLLRVPVEEGDAVQAGDTLAILTQATLAATLDGQRARVTGAEAAVRDLERGARPEEVKAAEAELSGAESDVARTTRDLDRARTLASGRAISQQAVDNASDAVATAMSRRDAARERLALLRAGARPERIRQARADVSTARAALAAAEANAADLVLLAPVDGVIFERYAEAGEVLTPGSPVLTVGHVSEPWVRVFLPARDAARIRLGQPAAVTLDGAPGRQFPGTVTVINPRAEFTPRAALTQEEREDLMFGVRIDVQDSTGAVKPGLPATAVLTPSAIP
jgi:HlyD family secretion protein